LVSFLVGSVNSERQAIIRLLIGFAPTRPGIEPNQSEGFVAVVGRGGEDFTIRGVKGNYFIGRLEEDRRHALPETITLTTAATVVNYLYKSEAITRNHKTLPNGEAFRELIIHLTGTQSKQQ
jgi:hypothetical protein